MALVVFLRGVNVGGHRRFRPAALAERLKHLGVVNIGAAGTFVVRHPVTRTRLRAELARELPFEAKLVICEGREITNLMSRDVFAGEPVRPEIVRFVSVLSKRPRSAPSLPMRIPSRRPWMVRLLARDDRFVLGVHRREMSVIGHLGALDSLFGAPATTRSWSTIVAIARVLRSGAT